MPIVPTTRGPTVTNNPAQDALLRPQVVRGFTSDAYGAGIGRALQGAGDQFSQLGAQLSKQAAKEKIENDEHEAKKLDIEFSAAIREAAYGNKEKPGYYSLQGDAASQGRKPFMDNTAEIRRKFMERATNDDVREMFELSSGARLEREFAKVDGYALQQRKQAQVMSSTARVGEAADDAAAAWNDDTYLRNSLSIAETEAVAKAELMGLDGDPKVVQRMIGENRSLILQKTINAAMPNDPERARQLYEDNKLLIDGQLRAEIETHLKRAELNAAGQKNADEIRNAGLSEGEAMTRARAIKDPQVRDETVKRLQARFAEDARIVSRQLKEAQKRANTAVQQGQSLSDYMVQNPDDADLINGDTATLNRLQLAEKNYIEGNEFARASTGELGVLRKMDDNDLVELELETRKSTLTRTEYDAASQMQQAAKLRIKRAESATGAYTFGDKALLAAMPKALKEAMTNKKTTDEGVAAQQLFNDMQAELGQWIAERQKGGGIIKPSEVREEASRLMLEITADPTNTGFLYTPRTGEEAFEGVLGQFESLSPQQKAVVRIKYSDIPQGTRTDIERVIRSRGKKVSEDLVEQLAGAMMVNDRPRATQLLSSEE